MKRLVFAVLLFAILCLSEVALLLLAVGALPTPTDRRLVVATSEFVRSPNTQTELDLYKESARVERSEVNIERLCSLFAVLNTAALMSALSYVKRLRERMRGAEPREKAVGR